MSATQTLRFTAPGGAADPFVANANPPVSLTLVSNGTSSSDDTPAVRRRNFGPRLKAAREQRGIALHDIAATTKVSASLLVALERGDVSRWPKGIFRRAFFRDYVVAIGLPADPNVAEFLELFPDGEEHPFAPAPAPRAQADAALRLTLAAEPRWQVSRASLYRAFAYFASVLLVVSVLAWWLDAGASGAAVMCALCYYPLMVTAISKRVKAVLSGKPDSATPPRTLS
jgi:transcriptional regulator with XRE-family HTH domain